MEEKLMFLSENKPNCKLFSCLTIDVEDWFHILDSPAVPGIKHWPSLESRIERNLKELLEVLDNYSVKVTFFWLGWLAERHKGLVRMCRDAGHEIASHGYAHILAYEVGPSAFREDITKAKDILENIISDQVRGFRAPGFSITEKAPWAFEVIKESGYQYDSSVFPAVHGHGGMASSPLGLYFIETRNSHLLEIPMSIVEIFGHRTSLFGGGYLRLANKLMIKWGIDKLQTAGRPLIVYIHPREIDPAQPHLPLGLFRQFKCYVNLNSTLPKLKWLCKNYSMLTMLEMVENYIRSFYLERKMIPVVHLQNNQAPGKIPPQANERIHFSDRETFRRKLLLVEKAMADFLRPSGPTFSQVAEGSGIKDDLNPHILQEFSIPPQKQDSTMPTIAAPSTPL
jgi:polysaccharide deacetylase family protein (PEP-CTERM system associated)